MELKSRTNLKSVQYSNQFPENLVFWLILWLIFQTKSIPLYWILDFGGWNRSCARNLMQYSKISHFYLLFNFPKQVSYYTPSSKVENWMSRTKIWVKLKIQSDFQNQRPEKNHTLVFGSIFQTESILTTWLVNFVRLGSNWGRFTNLTKYSTSYSDSLFDTFPFEISKLVEHVLATHLKKKSLHPKRNLRGESALSFRNKLAHRSIPLLPFQAHRRRFKSNQHYAYPA